MPPRISTRLDQVADVFYVTDQMREETARTMGNWKRLRSGNRTAIENFLESKRPAGLVSSQECSERRRGNERT